MSDDHSRAEEQQHIHRPFTETPQRDSAAGETATMPAPSPTILGDARLSGRGNAPVRAAAVQRLQQTAGNRATRQFVQRMAADSTVVQRDEDIGARIQARAGGGSSLDQGVQRQLETGLGASMDNVRVHNDGEADHLARSVDSVAFTTGSDIFFRSGAYNPSTSEGMHLLAHEATHTVQQAAGPVSGTPSAGGVSISDPSDSYEQAAEASASRVMSGQPATPAQRSVLSPSIQRATPEEEQPVQAMRTATYAAVQRAPAEEEEPVQPMRTSTYAAVQRAAAEEEEPVQTMRTGTYAAVQRAAAEDEEPVQTMRTGTYAAVQRAADEDEQPVQAMHDTSVQRAEGEDEEG
jgi:hypothetical protein